MKSKVLYIGASGFVGSRLIELTKEDFDICNLDKEKSFFYNEITKIGDVRDIDSLNDVMSDIDTVVLLAAEHRDDVSPKSLYYDVNVEGVKNVLRSMEKFNVNKIIFTSSVAVYGLDKVNPSEDHPIDPFNDYGISKWQAEEELRKWYNKCPESRSLKIIRPTVIFGERNRGNVYNLLKQIASGRFMMVGSGENYKSMAYIGNVVAFIRYLLINQSSSYEVYNYVDKPDINMIQLVDEVGKCLGKNIPSISVPYFLGALGGRFFDAVSFLTNKKFAISYVRVKKFCATTQFDAKKAHGSDFIAPYSLSQGLMRTLQFEFIHDKKDDITFFSE